MSEGLSEKGLQLRRQMFGDAFVDKRSAEATDFFRPFLEMVNNFAFADVWNRPVLDHKTRSMLTLAMLIANGRTHEMGLHTRGAVNNGVTKDEIREILLHAVVYCGFPAVLESYAAVTATLKDLGLE
ncbi:MAG TPA: carboxymuconolactone decarboxylase family protein [bacterium]|nr:carboxymuconolactone decarboxylase family protein [bacterium]